jgi:hypothetical protein
LRRLSQRDYCTLTEVLHRFAKADECGRFAFAERGRCDGRNIYVLGVGAILQTVERVKTDLCNIRTAIDVKIVPVKAELFGDLENRP